MDLLSIFGNLASIISLLDGLRKKQCDTIDYQQKENTIIYQSRPEMKIMEYKNHLARLKYGTKKPCDIELFLAHIQHIEVDGSKNKPKVKAFYNSDHFDQNEWCCVIYTLKNVGKTDINSLDIICLFKRDTCIFPVDNAKCFADKHLLNYSECYDKKIRTGETITLKLCYHKDAIITGGVSALLHIGMVDDNGRYWVQPLFAPIDKVYESRQVLQKKYMEELTITTAEECFANPTLW